MSKRALGKGIEALLSGSEDEKVPEKDGEAGKVQGERVQFIPLSQLAPNPSQPRKDFREETLDELAESIQSQGILQPLLVEKSGDGYHIIAGERRFRAAEKAGLKEVPVIVRSFTPGERFEIALIENIQREDLTPLEEAMAYETLIRESGLNQEDVAKRVGKKRSTIANSLRLLKMPEEMRKAINTGEITAGHARAILSVTEEKGRQILFENIMEEGLSVRGAEAFAAALNRGEKEMAPAGKTVGGTGKKGGGEEKKTAILKDLEQQFIDILGTKVEIRGGEERGEVIISYFSPEDLERILEILSDTSS